MENKDKDSGTPEGVNAPEALAVVLKKCRHEMKLHRSPSTDFEDGRYDMARAILSMVEAHPSDPSKPSSPPTDPYLRSHQSTCPWIRMHGDCDCDPISPSSPPSRDAVYDAAIALCRAPAEKCDDEMEALYRAVDEAEKIPSPPAPGVGEALEVIHALLAYMPGTIITHDMGECRDCGTATDSGMYHFCKKCLRTKAKATLKALAPTVRGQA